MSCKALSWRKEPSIGLWSIIFAMAANTRNFPFWYLALKRNQVSHSHPVVFDWPNMVYYVPIPQRDHGTVASLDTRRWTPECLLAEVPSLGLLARRFLKAGSFRIPRIMWGIGLALLLLELRPQVCYPIRRGLASVTPNGRSKCLSRAGVTVGAFEANANDDSN